MSQTFCKIVENPQPKAPEKKGPFARLSQWFTRLSAKAAENSVFAAETAALKSPVNVFTEIKTLSPDEAFARLMQSEDRAREVMEAGSHHDTKALRDIQLALFKQSGLMERMARVVDEFGQVSMAGDVQVLDHRGHQITVSPRRSAQYETPQRKSYVVLSGSEQNSTDVKLRSLELTPVQGQVAKHYQIVVAQMSGSRCSYEPKVLLDAVQVRTTEGKLVSTDVFASSSVLCVGLQQVWDKGAPKEAPETRLYKAITKSPRVGHGVGA